MTCDPRVARAAPVLLKKIQLYYDSGRGHCCPKRLLRELEMLARKADERRVFRILRLEGDAQRIRRRQAVCFRHGDGSACDQYRRLVLPAAGKSGDGDDVVTDPDGSGVHIAVRITTRVARLVPTPMRPRYLLGGVDHVLPNPVEDVLGMGECTVRNHDVSPGRPVQDADSEAGAERVYGRISAVFDRSEVLERQVQDQNHPGIDVEKSQSRQRVGRKTDRELH